MQWRGLERGQHEGQRLRTLSMKEIDFQNLSKVRGRRHSGVALQTNVFMLLK
jgi:hypothetical protein